MAIENLNIGALATTSQIPFYDAVNGQDRRASLASLLALVPTPEGGGSGPGVPELYVQPTVPIGAPAPYIWIQTGLGLGNDFSIWFEDGA